MKEPTIRSLFVLAILAGCHSSAHNAAQPTGEAHDSVKEGASITDPDRKQAVVLKTHLRDTTFVSGSFILFLLPDDARYSSLAADDTTGEITEGDADFGAGISGTMDSLSKNAKYKKVKGLVSVSRYILIKDCKGGPLLIDRDSVNVGYILSTTGKPIQTSYNSVHSGDYLGEIDEYLAGH
jgi:hypothetical protein